MAGAGAGAGAAGLLIITFSLLLNQLCLFSAAGDADVPFLPDLRLATVSLAWRRISRACSLAAFSSRRRRLQAASFFFFLPEEDKEVGELGMDMYCAARSRTFSLSACSDSLGPSHDALADVDARGVSGSDRASATPTLQLRLRSGSRRFMDSGITRFFFSPLDAGGEQQLLLLFSLPAPAVEVADLLPVFLCCAGAGDGEGCWSGRPSMPMRRATRLGVLGVSASDDGAVGLVERRMLVVLLARASNTGSICTPIWMSLGLSASRSRLFLGASRPLLLLLSPLPRPWQLCGVTMALEEEVGGRPTQPAPGAKMR